MTEIVTVACRLLREPRAELNQLPCKWLGELLGAVRARGQHRNDIVRRSAGLPFALMGLFLAEPPGSHKVRPLQLYTPVSCPAAGLWQPPSPTVARDFPVGVQVLALTRRSNAPCAGAAAGGHAGAAQDGCRH